jgi:hypothetical protein
MDIDTETDMERTFQCLCPRLARVVSMSIFVFMSITTTFNSYFPRF